MKALLQAIKAELKEKLTDGGRPVAVYITPHENYIPQSAAPPCVGLKDGGIARRELAGGMLEITLEVSLIIYVQLYKDEASIMGDAGRKGVLEIARDIHAALDENRLGIAGMQSAFSPSEKGSQLFGDDKESLQRKIITYKFTKEESRS